RQLTDDGSTYYLKNGHGDVTSIYTAAGTPVSSYRYDAFGNQLSVNENDTNPFRYCGEYYDAETQNIYLRNRYYDPANGRFMTEDPIRDGLNWYVYCENNPVNFTDSSGLEAVVVSGGAYSDESVHPGYKYNFIEPAIKKIRDLRASMPNERIGWCIANEGWSSDDWKNFQSAVSDIDNVHVIVINSSSDLTNYINYRSTGGIVTDPDGNSTNYRVGDEITKFAVFSHGVPGTLALGYNYNNSLHSSMSFEQSYIEGIYGSAFNNPNSWFYSCNTATNDNSFLKAWQAQVGGFAGGYSGTTTYEFITYSEAYKGYWLSDPRKWAEKSMVDSMREKYGFAANGSLRYPTGSVGVSTITFGVPK
ncbi:MAG: RHS repeat-associated core domain-containing protein, partial [Clostridia bacterium]|nr:RHS repeat-associated core domain-containing protein [Clostridia bacterium]